MSSSILHAAVFCQHLPRHITRVLSILGSVLFYLPRRKMGGRYNRAIRRRRETNVKKWENQRRTNFNPREDDKNIDNGGQMSSSLLLAFAPFPRSPTTTSRCTSNQHLALAGCSALSVLRRYSRFRYLRSPTCHKSRSAENPPTSTQLEQSLLRIRNK